MITEKRIGNLEFHVSSYLGEPPEHIGYQILKWENNGYFQRESEFVKADSEFYHYPDNKHFRVHKDCFKNPYTSYAIACFDYNSHEGCYELEFVGDRPLNLNEEERKIFWKLLEYGFKVLNYGNEES